MKDLPIVDTGTKRVIENVKIMRVKPHVLSNSLKPKEIKRE